MKSRHLPQIPISRQSQHQTLLQGLGNIGLLEHVEYVSKPLSQLSIRLPRVSRRYFSHYHQLHMNLLILKPVDFCGLASVKDRRNTSMKVVSKRGDMRILNTARGTTGNARLAGSAIA